MSISASLQQFKSSAKVILNEKYIDDKSAKEVAKFLQSHGRVEHLDLRSNDITGVGFSEIFRALLRNPGIRQLVLEHNRLGEEDDGEWPHYLSELIAKSPKLERINVSNNQLKRAGFAHLRDAVAGSSNLLMLEAKYNQIPPEEIASFVSELKMRSNQIILYVQISGNNAKRQSLQQLETILKRNRDKNPISKDNLLMTGGASNPRESNMNQTFTSLSRNNAIDDLSKENILRHLQQLLDQNRRGTTEMKNKLESQLADLQRRDKLETDEINELDRKCNELIIGNRNLKFQLDKTQLEHQQIEKSQQYEAKLKQQRIYEANKQLNDLQSKYQQIETKMRRDHESKLNQIARTWENRLRAVDQRIRDVQTDTNNVSNQIRKVVEKKEKMRADYEEEESILRSRVEEEESQRYRFKEQALEVRIKEIEESRQSFVKRAQEVLYQLDTKERQSINSVTKSEEQLETLKVNQQQLVNRNRSFMTRNENLKQEISLREISIEKLEQEINRLNEQIEFRKVHNREQIDKIIADHEYERTRKTEQKNLDIQKINELEGTLRNYQLENAKLEQEYIILEQKLQATLSKAVQEVFSQTQLY